MSKKLIFQNNPLLSGPALLDREKSAIPYREIPLAAIERDTNQPRISFDEERLNELAQSIAKYGVLSPVLVKPGKVPGRYCLIAGERRVRASRIAGLSAIPALVDHENDERGVRTLSIQLVENLQRSDLTPLERAHAIGALKEAHGLSVRDVAEHLGVSKSMVQRSLELLELPDDLLNALRQGASESKILLLAKIESAEKRAAYLKDLDGMPRRELEKHVEEAGHAGPARKIDSSPEDVRIADEIRRALGLKVKLVRAGSQSESGRIVIDFYSEADLQEIFRKLVNGD